MDYKFEILDKYHRRYNVVKAYVKISGFTNTYNGENFNQTWAWIYFIVTDNNKFVLDHRKKLLLHDSYPLPKPLTDEDIDEIIEVANKSPLLPKVLEAMKRI